MSFAWPIALIGLALIPLAVIAYLAADRRRARGAGEFANPALLPNLVRSRPGWRRHLPPVLALVALTALLVGLARPHATLAVTKEEATVILAIDTSRSMAADDVEPSRLEAAQVAAAAFLEEVPSKYQVGIVSFSTKADVVLPPTNDRDTALLALQELRLGSGTAIGDAIVASLGAIPRGEDGEEPAPASVLLLSDGKQDAEGGIEPLDAAQQAQELAVPVSTVALGTSEAVVEVPLPGGEVQQQTVAPDPETLGQIAQATGGQFFAAPDDAELEKVYRELGSRLASQDEETEMTYAFAAGGAVLLLVGGLLSTLWFRRPL